MAAPAVPPDAPGPVLKYAVDALDAIDQPVLRPFYAKDPATGKFSLRVEGHPATARLGEFRESNVSLNAKVTELEGKLKAFSGIDPGEVAAMRTRLQEYEAREPELTSKLSETEQKAQRVAELEQTIAAEREAHSKTRFRHAVTAAFLAAGGRPEAASFIEAQAANAFTLDGNGDMVSKEFSPTNPGAPLSLTEWVLAQANSSLAFAFRPSVGGGASTAPAGPGNRSDGPRRIPGDALTIGRNLEDVASGRAVIE